MRGGIVRKQTNRAGFSLVELEVAFVVFAIAMAGLCPLVVMQSKHLKRIENRFSKNNTYYVQPSSDIWARKLGACATITSVNPGTAPTAPITIIDDGDEGFSIEGAGWVETTSAESYLGDDREVESGDGTEVARWQFTGLKPGWYEVLATWLPGAEFASDAPFKIFDGSVDVGAAIVNQQEGPIDGEFAGKPWQSLGTFPISGSSLSVEVSNSANGKVIADGIRLVPVENEVRIISVEKSLNSEEVTAHVSVTERVPE